MGAERWELTKETKYNNSMKDIKAKHITKWSNKNAKFKMGDEVYLKGVEGEVENKNGELERPTKISIGGNYIAENGQIYRTWLSKKISKRTGEIGKVVAASSADGITFKMPNGSNRMWTRYFVQYADGYIAGIFSQCLGKAF